jgi:hypothetical protein
MSMQTETLLLRHPRSATVGVDAVMAEHVESSVTFTSDGTCRGSAEIRGFFTTLLDGVYRGFITSLKLIRQEVVGDVAFIVWDAPPWFRHATDTFTIGNDKILVQTISAPPSA